MSRLLSIQSSFLGHSTFATVFRAATAGLEDPRVDSLWHTGEDPDPHPGRLATLFGRPAPLRRVREANWDQWLLRVELTAAWQARRRLRHALGEHPYAAAHFHTQGLAMASLDIMRRMPVVVSGDQTAAQVRARNGDGRAYLPNVAADRRVFARAARVVMWSEYARRSAIEDLGAPPERVVTIPPGVTPELFDVSRPDRDGAARMLFIGHDLERKGGDLVLEMLRAGELGPVELDVVGDVRLEPHPCVRVHRGLSPLSLGWLDRFAEADIFVLPTRDEPYGLAVAEAQAAGLPVVATTTQALPEIVDAGRTGLLVPVDDRQALAQALRALVGDPARRAEMGRAARERARQRFDPRRQSERLIEVMLAAADRTR